MLRQIPGVITTDTVGCDASLSFHIYRFTSLKVVSALSRLEEKWELPNGEEICEAVDKWAYSRQLANGFFYESLRDDDADGRADAAGGLGMNVVYQVRDVPLTRRHRDLAAKDFMVCASHATV